MHVLWLHAYENLPKRCISLNVSQSESESYINQYRRALTFKHVNGNLEII